jgi:signal transduction histidine kinase
MLLGEHESIMPVQALIDAKTYDSRLEQAQVQITHMGPGAVADAVLQIGKRINDLGCQIEGFKILSNDTIPSFNQHNIKKALLNILYSFYPQLNEKKILVEVAIEDAISDRSKVPLDYKIFNVAIHHLLNNILKYVKEDSVVEISFDDETYVLSFAMTSLRIEKEEIMKIFKLKKRGQQALDFHFEGEGIGMYMVGKALELHKTRMQIHVDYASQVKLGGVPYTRNTFAVKLHKNLENNSLA